MAKVTTHSNRIYKKDLDNTTLNYLLDILRIHNTAKIKAYSYLAYNKQLNKSLHLTIKDEFNLNTYYANYAVSEAKWIHQANKEAYKMLVENYKDKIDTIKHKIKTIERKLQYWEGILEYIIELSKRIKFKGIPKEFKSFPLIVFYVEDSRVYVKANFHKAEKIYNLYDFEHTLVRKKINNYKNRLVFLRRGLSYTVQNLERLQKKGKVISCFGGRDFFLKQYTVYKNNHPAWKEEFKQRRYSTITMQGVNNVEQGNACVKYDYTNKTLFIQLPYLNKVNKNHQAVWIKIPNVYFKYMCDELVNALNTKGMAISWRIYDRGEYFLFSPTFDIVRDINYSKSDGVIGYDLNYNHIAWAETDSYGNLLSSGIIHFNIEGKSTGEISKLIEKKAIELVRIAKSKHKPLVGEDIKNINKTKLKYGSSKRNRRITTFAYRKLIQAISSRAYKDGIDVDYINPYNTSQIGRLKYMKLKGLSIHQSAAYCIARRGLNLKERVIKPFDKFTKDYSDVIKVFKDVPTHYLYRLPSNEKAKTLEEYKTMVIELNRKVS